MSDGRNLEAHLFICTNHREGKASCAGSGSVALRESVKKICQDSTRGWHGRVRVNTAGCLGRCEQGVVAVMYPRGEWYTDLKATDVAVLERAISEVLDK